MKYAVTIFLALITVCNDTPKNKRQIADFELENKITKIELQYLGMMCDCPQWATPDNIDIYEESIQRGQEIPMDSLFIKIVPENSETVNPFDLDYGSTPIFQFTGKFFQKKRKWKSEDGIEYNCKFFQCEVCELSNKIQ